MNLTHAQYVLTIIQEGGVTNAAKKLHISQPALSRTIRAVEKDIGTHLFEHNASSLLLTTAGEKYIASVKDILTIEDNMRKRILDIKQEEYGTIHLGIPVQRAMQILPVILPLFHKRYPNVQLDILEVGSADMESVVINGKVDIALLTTYPSNDELHYVLIQKEDLVLIANKQTNLTHRLPKVKPITIREAKDEKFIVIYKGHSVRKIQDQLFATYDLSPKIFLTTTSMEVAKHVCCTSPVVCICPNIYIEKNGTVEKTCRIYPLLGVKNKRYCYICYRKDAYLRKYTKDFIDMLVKMDEIYLR